MRAVSICLVLSTLTTGCLQLAKEEPDDPRCPKNWHYDENMDAGCRPPDGYTALLFAEFGGSGIYGFGRLTVNCFGDPACHPTMLPDLGLTLYRPQDVDGNVIDPDAVPIIETETSSNGVYKSRIEPGTYTMVCTDPYDGRQVTGEAEVKADEVALYAIDLDHSDVVTP